MSFVIDGHAYDLPFTVIKRKIDKLYKSGERTQDGVLHSELIGVYYNFDLSIGQSLNNVADYDDLLEKISAPDESSEITLPTRSGVKLTFDCYFANISDEVIKEKDDVTYFRNLTFSVIAISPARTP